MSLYCMGGRERIRELSYEILSTRNTERLLRKIRELERLLKYSGKYWIARKLRELREKFERGEIDSRAFRTRLNSLLTLTAI